MEKSTQRFVRGAVILSVAGIICKVIGAIYRIPLTNIIGTEAMGIYSKAYLLYALLWIISTSGLPSAIAKAVSGYEARSDSGASQRLFILARRFMLFVGCIFTALLMALSPFIAWSLGIKDGAVAVLCIAPSLLLVVVSAYMGYFQGKQYMTPSAITQVIGSSGKLLAGTALAFLWKDKGLVYAASGALLGVTASELLSILFIHLRYKKFVKHNPCPPSLDDTNSSLLLKRLIVTAVPITLCGAALPLLNTLDAYLITHCLSAKGFSPSQINSMYGVLNGMVSTLVNVPGALALALSAALLPFVSSHKAKNDIKGMGYVSSLAAKLALVLGLPCAVGLFTLAQPIISFLYPVSHTVTAAEQQLGVDMLRLICPAIVGLCLMHALTGALQGADRSRLPVISIVVAAVIKLGLGGILMLCTTLGIKSAPIASSAAFLVAGGMNIIFAMKQCNMRLNVRTVLVTLLASTVMGLVCYVANDSLNLEWYWLILLILLSAAIYFAILIIFKVFSKQELKMLPLPLKGRNN